MREACVQLSQYFAYFWILRNQERYLVQYSLAYIIASFSYKENQHHVLEDLIPKKMQNFATTGLSKHLLQRVMREEMTLVAD